MAHPLGRTVSRMEKHKATCIVCGGPAEAWVQGEGDNRMLEVRCRLGHADSSHLPAGFDPFAE